MRRIALLALALASCSTTLIEPSHEQPFARCEYHGTLMERVLVVGLPDPSTYLVAYPRRPRWHGAMLERVVSRFSVRPCPMGMP